MTENNCQALFMIGTRYFTLANYYTISVKDAYVLEAGKELIKKGTFSTPLEGDYGNLKFVVGSDKFYIVNRRSGIFDVLEDKLIAWDFQSNDHEDSPSVSCTFLKDGGRIFHSETRELIVDLNDWRVVGDNSIEEVEKRSIDYIRPIDKVLSSKLRSASKEVWNRTWELQKR